MIRVSLSFLVGILLAAAQLHAASGDLIVDGNIGVGTTTPASRLDVKGAGIFEATSTYNTLSLKSHSDTYWAGSFFTGYRSRGTGSSPTGVLQGDAIGFLDMWGYDGDSYNRTGQIAMIVDGPVSDGIIPSSWRLTATDTAGTYRNVMTLKNNGNVGIGTTNPQSILDVVGNVRFGLRQNGSNQPGYLANTWTTAEAYKFATLGSSYFNGSSWITNEGAGFGSNNVSMLATDIQGIKFYTQASNGNTQRTDTTTTFNTYERMRINISGNVGIGTANPAYTLDVNGTIRGTNVSPSDLRLKENIQPVEAALAKVDQMKGVSFNWKKGDKPGKNFPEGRHYGVIAQEIEKVLPEVVSTDSEGYKSVAYTEIIPVLIEAIKELQKEIIELKAGR